jgi:chemotaxis protein methyltransferase CheR
MLSGTDQSGAGAAGGLVPIRDEEFESIRALVYRHFGINLTPDKRTLLTGRLQKVLRRLGFATFSDYYRYVQADTTGAALSELAARISTNHTFFWRENDHFDFFVSTALPEAIRRHEEEGSRDLRVWCAGCSSGEEAYTLSMLMMEHLGRDYPVWRAGLLATDISETALGNAQRAIYSSDRIQGLPAKLREKYCRRLPDGDWTISEQVKKEVTLRSFNLMSPEFPFKKQFDVIFCRNVMIYFDQPTRNQLVARFGQWTVPGGYLFIGHSETLPRGESVYSPVLPAIYRKGGA